MTDALGNYDDAVINGATAPLAFWPMNVKPFQNEMSGSYNWSIAYDQGNSLVGPYPSTGKSTIFDGINDYSYVSLITGTATESIECWIQTTSSGGSGSHWHLNPGIIGRGYSTSYSLGYLWGCSLKNGAINFGCRGTTNLVTSAINDGQPHHIVMALGGNEIDCYLDGSLEGTLTGMTSPAAGNRLTVGRTLDSTYYYYEGNIDRIAFYDVEINSTLVSAHYNAAEPSEPDPGRPETQNILNLPAMNVLPMR